MKHFILTIPAKIWQQIIKFILLLNSTLAKDRDEFLKSHNQCRQNTSNKIPPLKWDFTLENESRSWAAHLATNVGELQHSKPSADEVRYGENLHFNPDKSFTPKDAVNSWCNEKVNFKPGGQFPDVSNTGKWQDVGHYTQVIWKETKFVGCGTAQDSQGNTYVVCRYLPPGNIFGEKPY